MIEAIIASKPTCEGSCKVTRSKSWPPLVNSLAAASHPGGKQAFRLQLLAAETDHHGAAAEIRIEADIAQRPDRNFGVRRIDGDAAAVSVFEPHHVIDVSIFRQQLGANARHRMLDNAGDTLHGCGDAEDVARSDRPVGIAVALERVAFERRRERRIVGRKRQAIERRRGRHESAAAH